MADQLYTIYLYQHAAPSTPENVSDLPNIRDHLQQQKMYFLGTEFNKNQRRYFKNAD